MAGDIGGWCQETTRYAMNRMRVYEPIGTRADCDGQFCVQEASKSSAKKRFANGRAWGIMLSMTMTAIVDAIYIKWSTKFGTMTACPLGRNA